MGIIDLQSLEAFAKEATIFAYASGSEQRVHSNSVNCRGLPAMQPGPVEKVDAAARANGFRQHGGRTPMPESVRCANGHSLPPGEALCPTCGTFVAAQVPPPPTCAAFPTVAGYELLAELAAAAWGWYTRRGICVLTGWSPSR